MVVYFLNVLYFFLVCSHVTSRRKMAAGRASKSMEPFQLGGCPSECGHPKKAAELEGSEEQRLRQASKPSRNST